MSVWGPRGQTRLLSKCGYRVKSALFVTAATARRMRCKLIYQGQNTRRQHLTLFFSHLTFSVLIGCKEGHLNGPERVNKAEGVGRIAPIYQAVSIFLPTNPSPNSHPVHFRERRRLGQRRSPPGRAQSSRAADGEPGRDGHRHGAQHVPALHRLGVQPHLDRRRRLLPLLRPDGHDLQHHQHHDAGGDGDGQVHGDRKSSQKR